MNTLNIFGRMRAAATKKNFLVAGVFVLALAGAISLGNATKQGASAATARDCSVNSVDYKNLNGGCGASDSNELAADIRANDPGDLQSTYNYFGLSSNEYDRFASTARQGVAKANGDVIVDGQVVMTDAWSIGRTGFSYSSPLPIGGTTFYKSAHTSVLQGKDHDVMVMFDENGTVEFAALNACGNATDGNKVKSDAECKKLNMTTVPGKANTYSFTTDVPLTGNAKITKVVYTFSDGTKVEKTNPNEAVEHTFKASGSAKVEVHVALPGGKTKVIDGANCVKQITVKIPYYACTQLMAVALNDKKTLFRFTVKTTQGDGATLKDADFTLDGSATTSGVTTKDPQGNIYKDYTFAEDGKSHKIVVKVNFNLEGGIVSKTCEANVTSTKAPVCEKPGKEMYPPNAPECVDECLPNVPKGDVRCTPPVELPKTGMGNVLGLFAGTSAFGAVAHRVVSARRRR